MRVLLCQAVCLVTDAVACFAGFAILWRKWVAIPASFEVVETPDGGGAEGERPTPTPKTGSDQTIAPV